MPFALLALLRSAYKRILIQQNKLPADLAAYHAATADIETITTHLNYWRQRNVATF